LEGFYTGIKKDMGNRDLELDTKIKEKEAPPKKKAPEKKGDKKPGSAAKKK